MSQQQSEDTDRRSGSAACRFDVCGVTFVIDHDQPKLLERLRRLWQGLFVTSLGPSTSNARCIRLSWTSECNVADSDPGQLLSDASGLRIEQIADGFRLDCGSASLRVDLASSVGSGGLQESFFQKPLDAQRRFLLLAIVMLIRRHKRFSLHAGGVTQAGRGCLIAGRSGSGKTTLGLSLIRQGWSNLSDDVVALRADEAGVEAMGLNRGFSCTMKTAQMFGEGLVCQGELGEKKIMQLTDADARPVTRCRPGLILFPTIGEASDSRLIPVRPIEAVNELIQFSAGIMINPVESAEQLEILNRLVARARPFRFVGGQDVFEYPEQVAQLISQQVTHAGID